MSGTDIPASKTVQQDVLVHRARVEGAAGISAVWEQLVSEKRYSAVTRAWSPAKRQARK